MFREHPKSANLHTPFVSTRIFAPSKKLDMDQGGARSTFDVPVDDVIGVKVGNALEDLPRVHLHQGLRKRSKLGHERASGMRS